MIIDCISDLHGYFPQLTSGDILILAGDYTKTHTDEEFDDFYDWLSCQAYMHKIVIAGNHDSNIFEDHINSITNCHYLEDSGIVIDDVKIWGSPWSLTFDGINPLCTHFTGTEEILKDKYDLIPDDCDILITHGPPQGILDGVKITKKDSIDAMKVGSYSLRAKIKKLTQLKYNIFGHIHEEYGRYEELIQNNEIGTKDHYLKYINSSYVNEKYEPVNKVVRIMYD